MADDKKTIAMPSTLTPGVRITFVILIAVIIAAVFGVSVYPTGTLHTYLADDVVPRALFVCPWDAPQLVQISEFMTAHYKQFSMGILALALFTLFAMGWNLYQNMLKDEFDKKSWEFFMKFMIPMLIVILIIWQLLTWTPNFFREVHVSGANGRFILCEQSTPGSRPVLADKVSARRRINP